MRSKKLAKNTVASLILQLSSLVSGFVVPRLILIYYGSEVNGLVNSITQFLHIIAFLELGVSAVVQSSLYRPLYEHDDIQVSKIVVSANRFFRRIGQILLCYVIVLMIAYPLIVNQSFGHLYTALLIAAMSISSFSQYYFGIVDYQLLTADQRGYIQYFTQTATIIVHTIVSGIIIIAGGSIQLVKLTTSLIYLIRPIIIRTYVNKHYNINRKITYSEEPIKQKWNGIAQHISAVVLDQTDTIVLTLLATLKDVSVYSVYHLVVYGVKTLFTTLTNSVQALLGEIWAKGNKKELADFFGRTEWVLHTGVVFIFGCTYVLILPFIKIYTSGVDDALYIQPLFSMLIVLAHAVHCLRLPYHILIKAGGFYKETQKSYIMSAIINIVVSVITVKFWGLIGVAIGTLVAMAYQTIWMIHYCYKELLHCPILVIVKQFAVDVITICLSVFISGFLKNEPQNYFAWIGYSIEVVAIWATIILVINSIAYTKHMISILRKIKVLRR